jgi:formylmethanofuran:tetrahydromethanopterin formyltransferase
MSVIRIAIVSLFATALVACGDTGADLKTKAGDLAKGATEFAAETVDTKTACMLAGQNEAFCGCVQDKMGARLEPEELKALTEIVARAVTAGSIEAAAKEGASVDPKIRDALAQCAVSGAIGEATEAQ